MADDHICHTNGDFSHALATSADLPRRIRGLWHRHFSVLFGPLSVRRWALSSTFCDRLILRHFEAQRYYHTLVHIYEVIKCLDLDSSSLEQKSNIFDKAVLFFSAIFHDAIYDPKSSTNESDSAALFRSLCELCPDSDLTRTAQRLRVVTIILATAKVRYCVW